MAASDKQDHGEVAASVKKALPDGLKRRTELVAGGGAYTLLKVDGRTVASVRSNGARVTYKTPNARTLAAAVKAAVETTPKKEEGDE